jgi:hypothetical protein
VTFLFPRLKVPSFWHSWGDWGRMTGGAEHSRRTRLSRCI